MNLNLLSLQEKNIFNLLFYFLIISFSIGTFIAELNLLLIAIFFMIYKKKNNSILELNWVFLYFVLFYIYIFFNAIFQINDNLKWTSIGYIRFILLSYFIYFLFKEDLYKSKKNFLILVIFLALIILDAIFQYLNGKNIIGFKIIGERVSGIFDDELILGSYCLKSFLIISSLLLINNIDLKKYKNVLIIFSSLIFFTIYIAAERTSFILLFLTLFLLYFLIKSFRDIIKKSSFIFILLILISSNFNLGQKSNPNGMLIFKTFNQITNYKFAGTTPNKWLNEEFSNLDFEDKIKKLNNTNVHFISDIHSGHYELALYLFKKNKLFGNGPRGFRKFCRQVEYDSPIGTCTTHPHNYLMQFLSELGIIGIIFYLFFAIFILVSFLKVIKIKNNLNNRSIILTLIIGVVINFFPIAPSGDFFSQLNSFYIFLNFGMLIFYLEKEKITYVVKI